MKPRASSEAVRRSMQSNRPRDTRLEREFRSALHRSGLRFRKNLRPLAGLRCEPDVVFTKLRLAIFIDGCWWHGCPIHGSQPVRNHDWWVAKLQTTKDRDARNDRALGDAGWQVLRFWEHEPLDKAVVAVLQEVLRLRGGNLNQASEEGAHD
jgi:DNA mismatch endonuclease (patch repair protein)